MTTSTNERSSLGLPARTPSHRSIKVWLAAAATAGLMIATPVLAHGGVMRPGGDGARDDASIRDRAPMRGGAAFEQEAGGRGVGVGMMLPGMLQRLPLGTTVTVSLYAEDPSGGAEVTTTLTATVGETSEAAFAQDLQDAVGDAAFMTVDLSERTERIDLTAVPDGARRAPLGFLARAGGPLEFGQTIEVAFFAAEDDASPTTSLSFTYGEDSEAAFRQAIEDAREGAVAVQVTLPAQSRTIDLASLPYAGEHMSRTAPGTFGSIGAPGMRGGPGIGGRGPGR